MFVANYGTVASPLHALRKKNAFMWNEVVEHPFEDLKRAMVTLHVLALPYFSIPFIVETNASRTKLGAVLS